MQFYIVWWAELVNQKLCDWLPKSLQCSSNHLLIQCWFCLTKDVYEARFAFLKMRSQQPGGLNIWIIPIHVPPGPLEEQKVPIKWLTVRTYKQVFGTERHFSPNRFSILSIVFFYHVLHIWQVICTSKEK